NISSRNKTSNSVNWVPPGWSITAEASEAQQSPDLASVVQEIVDRAGWIGGNAMAFVVSGTGRRIAESYEGSPANAPLLFVEYSVGEEGKPNQAPSVSLLSPADNTQINLGQSLTLEASASDADGSVVSVAFYAGNELVGTSVSSPDVVQWSPASTGSYDLRAVATDNEGAVTESAAVNVSVVSLPDNTEFTITSRVGMSEDDAEEDRRGKVFTSDTNLDVVYAGKGKGDQVVGLRFQDLNIPAGALIKKAYILFTSDSESSGASNLTIQGHASGNAAGFNNSRNNLSSRPLTSAAISWQPVAWSMLSGSTDQQTPDLSTIVQEIVNRSDYNSMGSMAFIITGSGQRIALSYDGSPSQAPVLIVEYSTANMATMRKDQEPYLPNSIAELTYNQPGSLQAYPNPFGSSLTVELAASNARASGLVVLTDLSGSTVIRAPYDPADGRELVIRTDHLKPGPYLVQVRSADGKMIRSTFIKK
ncbi:MAG: Ig-like domain-containing protein, partial [Cyclobacteriaceae bacterium]